MYSFILSSGDTSCIIPVNIVAVYDIIIYYIHNYTLIKRV